MKGTTTQDFLEFATLLVRASDRSHVIRAFCDDHGLANLMIFLPDLDSGTLLAAPGFPQTLRGGRQWLAFVNACLQNGWHQGQVPTLTPGAMQPAAGVAASGYVAVTTGAIDTRSVMEGLRSVLPLLGAALAFERATLAHSAQARIASEAARDASALAQGLDHARRSVQRELAARREAEEELRKRTEYLEILNQSGTALAAELVASKIIRTVADAGQTITHAEFGGFRSSENKETGFSLHYISSGTNPEVFNTLCECGWEALHARGADPGAILRVNNLSTDDSICQASRMLATSVKSCLFASVRSRTGKMLGCLVFGHREKNVFTREVEKIMEGLVAQASIALDNALLYQALNKELAEHRLAEEALIAARDELTKSNAELDRRVHERTTSLREALAQMEEFSYTVSHDLRAPLRGMQAYCTALIEDYGDTLPPEARKFVSKIHENAQRLDQMSLDVLAISKLARADIQITPVDLNALVHDLTTHYPGLQSPGTEIEVAELHSVLGHEPSLRQVLSNLLANALKFVKPGRKPRVRIWTEAMDKGGVRLWVEDEGIGIDPQYQHRLFNMFERVHPRQQFEGTGVGLAIVRKAVERMGGTCGVISDGKNGSRFWITLAAPNK